MARTVIAKGKYAQAFPSFGPERRGAPVTSFLRIDDRPIRVREKVYNPDVVVVLDPTVMSVTKVDAGLKPDGVLLVNSHRTAADIRKQFGFTQKLAVLDAMSIALEILKVPITNTVMLGVFAKILGEATPQDVSEPFVERFGPGLAAKNQAAFEKAYELSKLEA
jgi:pyruvate ferredoxin oxidoreductase gamma subunit